MAEGQKDLRRLGLGNRRGPDNLGNLGGLGNLGALGKLAGLAQVVWAEWLSSENLKCPGNG